MNNSRNTNNIKLAHWICCTKDAYMGVDILGNSIYKKVNIYKCSECNRKTIIKENYCPQCGSIMNNNNNAKELL